MNRNRSRRRPPLQTPNVLAMRSRNFHRSAASVAPLFSSAVVTEMNCRRAFTTALDLPVVGYSRSAVRSTFVLRSTLS